MIERPEKQVEENLVWTLILYFFQFYESYKIKFPTIFFFYSTCIFNSEVSQHINLAKKPYEYRPRGAAPVLYVILLRKLGPPYGLSM